MKHACGAAGVVPLLQCSLLRRAALSFDAAKVLLMLVTFLYLSSATHLSPVCIEVKDFPLVTDMHQHACYMLFDWGMKSHLGPC